MSMYFGVHNDGVTPIIHMTANTASESQLNGDYFNDSIFHSSLPYLEYSMYDGSDISTAGGNTSVYKGGTVYKFSIPNECLQLLIDGRSAFLLVQTSTFTEGFQTNPAVSGYYIDTGGSYDYANYQQFYYTNGSSFSFYPSSTYNKICTGLSSGTLLDVKIVVVNIDNSGYIYKRPLNSNGVEITPNDILINGNSVLKYKYISQCPINDTDFTFKANSGTKFQMINSTVNTSGVEISADASKSPTLCTIKSGGKYIFRSDSPEKNMMYFGIQKTYIGAGEFYATGASVFKKTVATGMSEGDMFLSFFKFTDAPIASVQSKLCKFTVGEITQVVHSSYFTMYGLSAYQLMHFYGTDDGRIEVQITLRNYYFSYIATSAYTISIVKFT